MRYPSLADRTSFETRIEPLYQLIAKVGEEEVGLLTISRPPDESGAGTSDRVALLVRSKRDSSVFPIEGKLEGTATRDGDLHLFFLHEEERLIHDGGPSSTFIRSIVARWSGLIVRPDGTLERLTFGGDIPHGWAGVSAFRDPDSVGLRGLPEIWFTIEEHFPGGLGKSEVEIRWRWDRRAHAYTMARPAGVR